MRGRNTRIEGYEETDHCLPRTLFKPIISLLTPNQTDHFPPLTLIVAADYASVVGILWTTYQCFVSFVEYMTRRRIKRRGIWPTVLKSPHFQADF
jgi:hypothetical protein